MSNLLSSPGTHPAISAVTLVTISDQFDSTITLCPSVKTANQDKPCLEPSVDEVPEVSQLDDDSVPDGGYAWVIVVACGLMGFWVTGTAYSWGVVQDALVEQGLSKPSTLAFIGSLAFVFTSVFGMINGRLIRKIGARKVAFIAVVFMSTGQITSSWTLKNLGGLFVTWGCISGYGLCASYMVISVVPTQYFRRHRGLANGLVTAGIGLGGAAISLAMSAIIEWLGTAWTLRLNGSAMLICCLPAAWLIKERAPVKTTTLFEWKLFRDSKFAILYIAGMIALFPFFAPPFFLPLYARSIGHTVRVGAALVAAFNFSSAVGRILCGFLGDKLGAVNSLLVSLFFTTVSMLAIWPVSTSIGPLVVFVIVNGFGNGGFFAIMPTVVGSVFGNQRVTIGMGMMVTGWAPGYLLGAPIAGYLLEAYGGQQGGFRSYRPAIFWAGAMAVVATGLVVYLRVKISKRFWDRC